MKQIGILLFVLVATLDTYNLVSKMPNRWGVRLDEDLMGIPE